MRLTDDKDIAAVSASISQVIKDAIGQAATAAATVLIPAIEAAAKRSLSGIAVSVTVEPIKLSIEIGEKQ